MDSVKQKLEKPYKLSTNPQAIFTFSNSKMSFELYNINSLTDDLQYTIKYPSHDESLPYMDILIHADKSKSVYRKPTRTNLYVRYNSCAPSFSKDSAIRSLTRRAHILCSPNTYKKNWTQSTQPPYRVNASWTVSNKN